MTLEQLRIFVAVAERQHVTRAARDLHLTQSATSAAVAALEERYQVRLFDRVGRSIVLTAAGQDFLAEARAILARAAGAEAILGDLAGLRRGTLRLAASQTVGGYWLPPFIHRYRGLHPGIDVSLAIGNTEDVARRVLDGGADLGFIEGEIDDPHLALARIADDRMVLVAPPGHPWAVAAPDGAAAVAAAGWVMREPGSGTRAIGERFLAGHGLTPADLPNRLEMPANEAVRTAVEAGAGVAILSRLVVEPSLAIGALALVDMAVPARQFSVLRHRERYHTRAAAAFLAVIPPPGPPA